MRARLGIQGFALLPLAVFAVVIGLMIQPDLAPDSTNTMLAFGVGLALASGGFIALWLVPAVYRRLRRRRDERQLDRAAEATPWPRDESGRWTAGVEGTTVDGQHGRFTLQVWEGDSEVTDLLREFHYSRRGDVVHGSYQIDVGSDVIRSQRFTGAVPAALRRKD